MLLYHPSQSQFLPLSFPSLGTTSLPSWLEMRGALDPSKPSSNNSGSRGGHCLVLFRGSVRCLPSEQGCRVRPGSDLKHRPENRQEVCWSPRTPGVGDPEFFKGKKVLHRQGCGPVSSLGHKNSPGRSEEGVWPEAVEEQSGLWWIALESTFGYIFCEAWET